MACGTQTSAGGGDRLELREGGRPFDGSATAWLVGQGVRYLNTADKEGELAYLRVVEVLRRCGDDLAETVAGLARQANSGDAPLRWSLLHVLGDAGDGRAADLLVRTALRPLPEAREDEGCEGARDMELLVGTMAVHALRRIAERHPEAAEAVLKLVAARPARPLLIEAVKAARELGLGERARDLLPKDDHWIFEIRRAHAQELRAEPGREDGKERGFMPPRAGLLYTAPHAGCCAPKEG